MSVIQTSAESADRLGAHRTVARRAVEFPRMGAVLWSDPDFGKICMGKSARQASGICTAYLYVRTCADRLGIFLQSVAWSGYGLSRCDVRCGGKRMDRPTGILLSADPLAVVPALCDRIVSSRNEYPAAFDRFLREQTDQTDRGVCGLHRYVPCKPCVPCDRKFSSIFVF